MKTSARKPSLLNSMGFSAILGTALFAAAAAALSRRAEGIRPARPSAPAAPAEDLAAFLPPAETLPDWIPAASPSVFTPKDLFELIDGGADLVIEYGFRRLLHAEYRRASDPGTRMNLDLYDMGTAEGAFGIYSYERGDRPSNEEVGDEGVSLSSSLAFRRGRHYVKFETNDLSGTTIRSLRPAALRLASLLPGPPGRLEILELLPREGLVAGSARLLLHGPLGFESLGKTWLADYRRGDRRGTLFLCPHESGEAARAKMALLAEEMQGRWAVKSAATSLSGRRLEDGETIRVRIRGPFLAGITGTLQETEADGILEALPAESRR